MQCARCHVQNRAGVKFCEDCGARLATTCAQCDAECHFGLARLLWRIGDRARAREHLTMATTMYRAMDMELWLETAQGEVGTAS